MTRDEIAAKITGILIDDFGVPAEAVTADATFRGSFGLDSLDIVDLILLLQKDFGYKAPTEAYRELATFSHLVDFVADKAGGGGGEGA